VTDDEFERLLAKREEAARFRELEEAAFRSQLEAKKAKKKKPKRGPAPKQQKVAASAPSIKPTHHKPQREVDENCRACGRPMWRPSVGKVEGKVRADGHGLCSTCAERERVGSPLGTPIRDQNTPEKCSKCERPLRPHRARAADHPGTVKHAGHGLCTTCARGGTPGRKGKGGRPRQNLVTPCVKCETPTVARGNPLGEGQRYRAGRGLCVRCYAIRSRAAARGVTVG
jgi:hypothetical protein